MMMMNAPLPPPWHEIRIALAAVGRWLLDYPPKPGPAVCGEVTINPKPEPEKDEIDG